jgi:hypothetical protein
VKPRNPGAQLARLVLVVIAEVQLSALVESGWTAGPLVTKWREGTPKEVTSNTAGRTYYLNEGLESCLYRRDGTPVRWHKIVNVQIACTKARFEVVELLQLPDLAGGLQSDRGLAAMHIIARDLTVAEAEDIIYSATNLNLRHGADMRQGIDSILLGAARLSVNSRRTPAVSFLTATSRLPKLYGGSKFAETTAMQQWLYFLENQARIPPSSDILISAATYDTAISDDYSGRVSRFGIALVARHPETGATRGVHESIEFFARGLYVDLMLFAVSQHILLNELSTRTTAALENAATVRALNRMRVSILWYRRLYNRSDFAPQPPYDRMLQQYGTSVDLARSMDRVQHDVDDLATRLQAELTRQTNAILGLIAIIGLPLNLAIAVWKDLSPEKTPGLLITLSVAFTVSLILILGTRARNLLRDLRSTGGRGD